MSSQPITTGPRSAFVSIFSRLFQGWQSVPLSDTAWLDKISWLATPLFFNYLLRFDRADPWVACFLHACFFCFFGQGHCMDHGSDTQVETEFGRGCKMLSSLFLRALIVTDFIRDC